MDASGRIRAVSVPSSFEPVELSAAIRALESFPMGNAVPPFGHQSELVGGRRIIRLRELSAFWPEQRLSELARQWEQALASLSAHGDELWFLISFDPRDGFCYAVLEADDRDEGLGAVAALESALPGVVGNELSDPRDKAIVINSLEGLSLVAASQGVPSVRAEVARADNGFVSRVARAAGPRRWGLLIQARPWSEGNGVDALLTDITERVERVSPWVDRIVPGKGGANATQQDPLAERYVDLHRTEFERLSEGRRTGLWDVRTFFYAAEPELAATFRAAVAGLVPKKATAFPIGVLGVNGDASPSDPQTVMTSAELGVLTRPPSDELPGFAVREWARFDASPESVGRAGQPLVFGHVVGHKGTPAQLVLSDITRHACVAGITGSGKSTAIWSLLGQLAEADQPVPFLIIEPAKREYRELPIEPPIRVYTVGDERVSPLRLNPFEVPAGILVQTHLDYLNALFRASFALYPPMPYVLERCLYEIYVDRGWDLSSRGDEIDLPFPTLADLQDKVEEVSARLGYGAEVTMNVRAALTTRIGTLRIGAKGAMLDTSKRFDADDFLAHPTVVELERVGNDEEKAFFMGLLLTRVLERRQAQGRSADGEVRHVTVIEEAHRLLRNRAQSTDPESANPAAHAVEQFANMLAEVRSLGEGIIVADQIPSKLAPDVVKNTNVKLIFRLPAEDDKQSVGSTINLGEEQGRVLTSLPRGEALVFWEGMDNPIRIKCGGMDLKSKAVAVSDEQVAIRMAAPGSVTASGTLGRVAQLAAIHAQAAELERVYRHWLLAPSAGAVQQAGASLSRRLAFYVTKRIPSDLEQRDYLRALFGSLAQRLLRDAGRDPGSDGWDAIMGALEPAIPASITALADSQTLTAAWFASAMTGRRDGLTGCSVACPSGGCIYGWLGARIASDDGFLRDVDDAVHALPTQRGTAALLRIARAAGSSHLTNLEPAAPTAVGVCALVHVLNASSSDYTIDLVLTQLGKHPMGGASGGTA